MTTMQKVNKTFFDIREKNRVNKIIKKYSGDPSKFAVDASLDEKQKFFVYLAKSANEKQRDLAGIVK